MSSLAHLSISKPQNIASRNLYSPSADGLLLGGGSVLAFIAIRSFQFSGEDFVILATVMLLLSNFVNHPHFAHSYQIFYDLREAVRAGDLPRSYRRRWLLAAYLIPLLLLLSLAFGVFQWNSGNGQWLGALINIMGALVGWHYVKQGFGMALLDASIKRQFWPDRVRKALLANAYACWIAAWTIANASGAGAAFWGVFQVKVQVPSVLVVFFCCIAFVTTLLCIFCVARAINDQRVMGLHWREMPLNGLMAYFVTLYLWTLFAWADPAYALVIPFFHSLQYMAVVWRYKLNEAQGAAQGRFRLLLKFAIVAVLLGALGFWLLPGILDYSATGRLPFQSSGVFVAVASAWLFINIHHYFIDSVVWRKENPMTKKYLFSYTRGV